MFTPPTWIADTYLGRAASGRSRALRLSCHRQSEEGDTRGEFFVKTLGLPEITEQHLFSEAIGNLLAGELGIVTPDIALIEIAPDFASLLHSYVRVDVPPGLGIGGRSLGSSLSPPVFGRMSDEQMVQAARIYLFDMLVQNPDRRRGNENCFVVGGSIVAIDFAECFSFLYPVIGGAPEPWCVPAGISAPHVFRGTLGRSSVEWPMLFETLHEVLDSMPDTPVAWLPPRWEAWMIRVRQHLAEVRAHFDEFQWEILGSLA